jgi:hypothetical protein
MRRAYYDRGEAGPRRLRERPSDVKATSLTQTGVSCQAS